MVIAIRRSAERGYFNYDWLKTYHTFSFGSYHDPKQMGFRSLRVINEDRVKQAVGFPLHGHQDMEIFSIVLEGGLAHQDDMGNGSILRPGQVQLMSAGTGVSHSESNASDKESVHFLQVWIIPDAKRLEPSYQEAFFPESSKENQWRLIVSKDGRDGSLTIHQDASVYLANLDQGRRLAQTIEPNRYGWLQVIKGEVGLNDETLQAGDGAAISQITSLTIDARLPSQLLYFDLN